MIDAVWNDYEGFYPPIAEDKWLYLLEESSRMFHQYPREIFKERLSEKSIDAWVEEAHELAVNVVYDGLKKFDKITQEYADRARPLVFNQVALAGYRISDLISEAFSRHLENEAARAVHLSASFLN